MRNLWVAAVLTFSGCASFEPAKNPHLVIAIAGYDNAMKARIDPDIPAGDDKMQELTLYFSTDGAGCSADQAHAAKVIGFHSAGRVGEMMMLHGAVLTPFEGYESKAPPGDYAFRDAVVRWYPRVHVFADEYDAAQVGSRKESLAFTYSGGPAFIGAFRVSLEGDRMALTPIDAPQDVVATAASRLGVTGNPPRPSTRNRELVRCRQIEGIKRD